MCVYAPAMSLLTTQFKELESIDSTTRTNTNQDYLTMISSHDTTFHRNILDIDDSISIFKLYNEAKLNLQYKERLINYSKRLQFKKITENNNILNILKLIDKDDHLKNEETDQHMKDIDMYMENDTPYGSFSNDFELNESKYLLSRPIPTHSNHYTDDTTSLSHSFDIHNNNNHRNNSNNTTTNFMNMNFSLTNEIDSFQNNSNMSLSQFHYLDDTPEETNWDNNPSNSLPSFTSSFQVYPNAVQQLTPSRTPSYQSIQPLVSNNSNNNVTKRQPKKPRRKNSIGNSPDSNNNNNNANSSNKNTKCNNCQTYTTPLWRKDTQGNSLCNACGLFLKLHGVMRPLSLKTDIIKKRQRNGNGNNITKRTGSNTRYTKPNVPPSLEEQGNLDWLSIKL